MARDNGSRGSYRYVSASMDDQEGFKQETHQQQQQQHLVSPASSSTTATPPTRGTFQNLHRESLDGGATNADRLFDLAPDLLNARFPSMSQQQRSVPGSLPRLSLYPQTSNIHEDHRDRVTWVDIAIANLTFGSAVIGFMVIMYDGATTIASLLWSGVMGLMMSV